MFLEHFYIHRNLIWKCRVQHPTSSHIQKYYLTIKTRHQRHTLVTVNEPQLTLKFTLGGLHFMGLDKCRKWHVCRMAVSYNDVSLLCTSSVCWLSLLSFFVYLCGCLSNRVSMVEVSAHLLPHCFILLNGMCWSSHRIFLSMGSSFLEPWTFLINRSHCLRACHLSILWPAWESGLLPAYL